MAWLKDIQCLGPVMFLGRHTVPNFEPNIILVVRPSHAVNISMYHLKSVFRRLWTDWYLNGSRWRAHNPRRSRGEVLGSGFAGYVPLASQNPHPIIVYSVANYRPHLSHFWVNVIVISRTEFNASWMLNIKTTAGTIFSAANLPTFKSLLTRIFLSQKSQKFATPF